MLELVPANDPVLRGVAGDVVDFGAARVLASKMRDLMNRHRGLGLAAPQVGVPLRLVVFSGRVANLPYAVANPVVVARSPETALSDEGCLSLPGVRLVVPRSVWVDVAGVFLGGAPFHGRLAGLAARVFQHEVDHLAGVLITDRVPPPAPSA